MSNKWSGVKSIVNYYQDDDPSNPKEGEIWYRPSAQSSYLYNGTIWKTVRGSEYLGGKYGFIAGGYEASPIYVSTIDRVTFPFDSGTASLVGNLNESKGNNAGCNSSNYGYVMGGYSTSLTLSSINRITFPFDSGTASAVGNIANSDANGTGHNSSQHGYYVGGEVTASSVQRFSFPFDSGTASIVGNMATTSSMGAGVTETLF